MEKNNEYYFLYSQYENKPNEDLIEIINSKEEYRDIAKKVSLDILSSRNVEGYDEKENIRLDKIRRDKAHPLYNDIHQIANDISFIKNIILVVIVLNVLLSIAVLIGLLI